MARAEAGKSYLVVTCKNCKKGFRVVDTALEDSRHRVDGPQRLTCRGCGHQDMYAPNAMVPAYFVSKPAGD